MPAGSGRRGRRAGAVGLVVPGGSASVGLLRSNSFSSSRSSSSSVRRIARAPRRSILRLVEQSRDHGAGLANAFGDGSLVQTFFVIPDRNLRQEVYSFLVHTLSILILALLSSSILHYVPRFSQELMGSCTIVARGKFSISTQFKCARLAILQQAAVASYRARYLPLRRLWLVAAYHLHRLPGVSVAAIDAHADARHGSPALDPVAAPRWAAPARRRISASRPSCAPRRPSGAPGSSARRQRAVG